MKKSAILLSRLAGFTVAALLLGTSAFADSRPLIATVSDQHGDYDRHDRRDRHDVNIEGRVTNITRAREGYRVELDRGGYSFWVRDLNNYRGGGRHGALRVGINIRIAGTYEPRWGYVVADSFDWLDEAPLVTREMQIRGVVDRVDYRRNMLVLRDEGGRFVNVDMTRNDRHWNRDRGIDLRDLHRGDRVTLSGSWARRDLFVANHVESIRAGRY